MEFVINYKILPLLLLILLKTNSMMLQTSSLSNKVNMKSLSMVKKLSYEENIKLIDKAINKNKITITNQLKTNQYAIVDNFLGINACKIYRNEAIQLFKRGDYTISQSTRWDSSSNSIITYDKHNVYSTQLSGGSSYYNSPRLHEYVSTLVSTISPLINDHFPNASLSTTLVSNKLAVCIGNGSRYDKHFDNSGADDLRKLTVLYYMNYNWRAELGGEFRIFLSNQMKENLNSSLISIDEDGFEYIDIPPIGDRLLMFWSDELIHSVLPSQAPRGESDHRYALTTWFTTTDTKYTSKENDEMSKHFSNLSERILTP